MMLFAVSEAGSAARSIDGLQSPQQSTGALRDAFIADLGQQSEQTAAAGPAQKARTRRHATTLRRKLMTSSSLPQQGPDCCDSRCSRGTHHAFVVAADRAEFASTQDRRARPGCCAFERRRA